MLTCKPLLNAARPMPKPVPMSCSTPSPTRKPATNCAPTCPFPFAYSALSYQELHSPYTGWGWMGAAKLHQQCAEELMKTGNVTFDPTFPDKPGLLEMDLYDDIIKNWAEKTGRPVRD